MILINLKQIFIGWLKTLDDLAISIFLLFWHNCKKGHQESKYMI